MALAADRRGRECHAGGIFPPAMIRIILIFIWQPNKQTTVIPVETRIFWQTPTLFEAIPATVGMTILEDLIASVIVSKSSKKLPDKVAR